MAKSDRHKKLRKKEKSKTQLTGVKKLGKPQNVIEPTFRAKKIMLREQLQGPSEGEVVQSSRNRSLQDILHTLNHHNTNIKKDGINGLQEIISSYPESLYANLDKILETIASLTSDIEGSIRKENMQLAENIFAQVTEDQIKPFWNLLLTHIKCTLTNLNPTVRHNCLPFISLLLSYFPNLVSNSLHILLPSVLGLISSVGKSMTTSDGKQTKASTQLKLEISGKQENSKERIRVLQFLAACLDLHNSKSGKQGKNLSSNTKATNNSCPLLTCTEETPLSYIGLYYPFGYQESQDESYYYGSQGSSKIGISLGFSYNLTTSNYSNLNIGSLSSSTNTSSSTNDDKNDNEFWTEFVESCIPLLHQTWLEVRPSMKDGRQDIQVTAGKEDRSRGLSNLPNTAIEILECITSVMTRLIVDGNILNSYSWDLSNELGNKLQSNFLRRLRKNQGHDLKKYFFKWLPFSAVQDTQRKLLTLINLQLFHIAAKLRLIDSKIMDKLEQYLDILMNKSALDSMQISTILKILPLIRISTVDELTSKILNYAVNSGYFDSVNNFLQNILQLGENDGKNGLILNTINWEHIVSTIMTKIPSLTSSLLNILTSITLQNLIDLKSMLYQHKQKIEAYLTNGTTKQQLEAWDNVTRLFHYTNCLDILLESNYFGLLAPAEVKETVKALISTNFTSDRTMVPISIVKSV